MKRTKFGGIADTITVEDAETIRELAADGRADPRLVLRPPINGLFLYRLLRNLSYKGSRFPHMLPKDDVARQTRHDQLWAEFNARVAAMAEAPRGRILNRFLNDLRLLAS